MPNRILPTVLIALSLALGGCISAFNPVNGEFKTKGKTMAVIAGLDNEPNMLLAQAMTESLKKNTRFQVISQKQVKQAIPSYPDDIQGPWKSAYFEIEMDYTMTDMKKVRQIQQKLGVDYLYVLWTPSATVYNGKIHQLNIISQMFESGKEVANGRFGSVAGHTDCCLVPAPNDKDKANAIKDTADYVSREIGEKTGMAK